MADETGQKKTTVDDDYNGLERYASPGTGQRVVLVDLDGTTCLRGDRSPYDETRVGEDTPNEAVLLTVQALAEKGIGVIFMSGRQTGCRSATEAWLAEHYPYAYTALYMRPNGDTRRDWVVKAELFDKFIRHRFDVVLVLDDRDQVVKAWRAMGLTVFQVADGNF